MEIISRRSRPAPKLEADSWELETGRCKSRNVPYHDRVSTPTARGQRNWQTGEVFTVSDATELYEVERWGKGYFSISQAGDVLVHPTKDPARSIDLKQLTDHLML